VSQQVVCSCAGNTHATCMTLQGRARPKESGRCDACTNGKSNADAMLCSRWRLVKVRSRSSQKEKAKKLSAEAAGMPDQPARSGPRVGEYNEGRVVDEWQSTGRGRDTMDQARQGGACV
jgi:hypothetical protein